MFYQLAIQTVGLYSFFGYLTTLSVVEAVSYAVSSLLVFNSVRQWEFSTSPHTDRFWNQPSPIENGYQGYSNLTIELTTYFHQMQTLKKRGTSSPFLP
jgi:hypothetical protein